jgi:hypothetical protein
MCRVLVRAAAAIVTVFVFAVGWPVRAQIVVTDPAVTLRNTVTAVIHELLFNTQRDQRRQIRRMARRLAVFTNLDKYAITETPAWRIHDFQTDVVLFAHAFHAALNYGDARGTAYVGITDPIIAIDDLDQFGPPNAEAWTALRPRLATVDAADAVAMSTMNDTGLLRFNGRREKAAIEALESQVIDPSQEQSTTAVLDKISGAELIAVRQRQARTQFIVGILEQLLIDTKRARDAEAVVLNMQLATWRDGPPANAAFAAGAGDALRAWRQP